MKRAISLALTAALLGGLCAPALAAEDADARLSAVTQTVKETLALDTEGYDSFYGDLSENELAPTWSLSWSGEAGNLEVTASERGKILSYYRSDSDAGQAGEDFAFPAVTEAQGQELAQAFLDQVLDRDLEQARFTGSHGSANLSASRYYYSGTVDLNGLPSPLTFSISVRVRDGAVTSFSREDLASRFMGGVPAATPTASQTDGAALLGSTKTLRLEYVLTEDGKTAVLRYLPNQVDEYYVDAKTGQLVNLSALYADLMEGGEGGAGGVTEAAADSVSMKNQLTAAELKGVAQMSGVLDQAALDQMARGVTELGLDRYALAQTSYTVDRQDAEAPAEEAKVTARLTYGRMEGEHTWRRHVTLDAKTGALMAVSSSIPWTEEAPTVTGDQAQAKAEAFLSAHYQDQFAQCALYERADRDLWVQKGEQTRFTFAQQVNGYFYAGNQLTVSIDPSDGSVSGFSRSFDEALTFADAQGLISMETAQAAYAALYDAVLCYVAVPQKVDLATPDIRPLLERMGRRYYYTLVLAYGPESNQEGYVSGIDAKTGQPVMAPSAAESGITYSDLEGHWVQTAAEALAEYGVGWTGGVMEPGKALTQLDLVALLVSVQRGATETAEADALYRAAYQMGLLTKGEREDGKIMTRLDILRLLLDGTGYGKAAKLPGIYQCSGFADGESIPPADLGYAAIAQALGIVSGDGNGNFAPLREATRAEAVGMLYNLMSR